MICKNIKDNYSLIVSLIDLDIKEIANYILIVLCF